ncbi:MAG: glutamine-hydrolyzing carbamoyl-phosphate synthase small subunit [Acidobacteriaceae bacterium]|jgi:carbamoyl-phosphate synthase small subunit|nr:glutamine-hydrolyzing carbamoyl-phosphate synthase small subunit [Acidobacteriaceae bacterium]
MQEREAVLVLEDGSVFRGMAAGADGVATGEVVFNTSLSGYQEILTDPSYSRQIVTMTCAEIGNYGVSTADVESRAPRVAGFVIRDESPLASNWRATGTLRDYLASHGIVAISDIDTRALTRLLRSSGVMRGVIATGSQLDVEALVQEARQIPQMEGSDLVTGVTTPRAFDWQAEDPDEYDIPVEHRATRRLKIAAYDFGMKWNILRRLSAHNCDIRVYPAATPAADVLATNPDGVFLSNGPGDPAAVPYAITSARQIVQANIPTFGICLGHQILGLAMGGKTFKLKFGHRGGNHPVKNLETGKIEITSQNHGFAVDPASLPSDVLVTHTNLYDGTVEGLRHKTHPVFSVQYHPEAAPGPHDADYLFQHFVQLIEERRG